jgi:hypothetical protein
MSLYITEHAIERFMEKTNCHCPVAAEKKLAKMLAAATPVKKKRNVLSLINNGFKEVRYLLYSNWVLVVEAGRVVTAYQANPNSYVAE